MRWLEPFPSGAGIRSAEQFFARHLCFVIETVGCCQGRCASPQRRFKFNRYFAFSVHPRFSILSESSKHGRWFATEVQPHECSLRAYLHAAAPQTVDAEDLLQDAYLRLLRVRASEPIRCVRALLFAIARNAVRDAVRQKIADRKIHDPGVDPVDVMDETPGVVDLVSRRQEYGLLAEAIRALPDRCREVLVLRKIHGLSQKEIAGRLGITENTVESLVSRGVKRCANDVRKAVRADQ